MKYRIILPWNSIYNITRQLRHTLPDFLNSQKELRKKKVKLSLSEEAEWMKYFNEQKEKALSIQSDIDRTDREIDAMVYGLNGQREEEIALVERDK